MTENHGPDPERTPEAGEQPDAGGPASGSRGKAGAGAQHGTPAASGGPASGGPAGSSDAGSTPGEQSAAAGDEDPLAGLDFEPSVEGGADAELLAARSEAAEHLEALLRERASFTNYRKRALRDQEAARALGIEDVVTGLLPVLDDIERARAHDELTGPFEAISEKLDGALAKLGVERYGAVGDAFDPTVHDALMHQTDPEATDTTVNIVIEHGYRIGDKIVRAARVSVVGPEE